jgi:hypothetical protein
VPPPAPARVSQNLLIPPADPFSARVAGGGGACLFFIGSGVERRPVH